MTVTLESDGHPMITAQLERTFLGSDVEMQPVRTEGLVGTLFLPAGASHSPGILVVGGSEGGLLEPMAALLASHGYATLALAYHGVETLPRTFMEIPWNTSQQRSLGCADKSRSSLTYWQ